MSIVKMMLKQAQTSKPAVLNLTAMVDMMTILVVFLLKSMDVSSIKMPGEDIRLPAAYTGDEPEQALLVQISNDYISVNEKVIVKLENGKIKKADVAANDLYLLPALEKVLLAEAEKSKNIEKETGDLVKFKGTMFMQAHKDLDYAVLKRVMYTSSVAGYGDLRLATVTGGE